VNRLSASSREKSATMNRLSANLKVEV